MGSFSIWHWVILLVMTLTTIVPSWLIVKKAGFSGAWSLLMLVPVVNFFAIWVFALMRWPTQR